MENDLLLASRMLGWPGPVGVKLALWLAYLAFLALLYLAVSWLLALRSPPPGLRPLETPPSNLIPLAVRDSDGVADVFERRRESRFFRIKAYAGAMVLVALCVQRHGVSPREWLRQANKASGYGLDRLLDNAEYYHVWSRVRLCVLGFACKERPPSGKVVLALEPWVIWSRILTASVADHELMHCIQQVVCKALDREWGFGHGWRGRGAAIATKIRYELHAGFFGAPCFTSLVFCIVLWPLVVAFS